MNMEAVDQVEDVTTNQDGGPSPGDPPGMEVLPDTRSDDEKRLTTEVTAYHEAGHAAAGLFLRRGVTAVFWNLSSSEDRRRAFVVPGNDHEPPDEPAALRLQMVLTAAGPQAEELFVGTAPNRWSGDEMLLVEAARKLHGAIAPMSVIDQEIEAAHRRARALVRLRWDFICALAGAYMTMHDRATGSLRCGAVDMIEYLDGLSKGAEPVTASKD